MTELEGNMPNPASSAVFEVGKYDVTTIPVKTSDPSEPPVELLVVAPLSKGTYPVLLFCHGFMLQNTWYTDLLKHISSHGYIVVAPKFYGLIPISIPGEVKMAAQVTEWLFTGLIHSLPENVAPDTDNLALSGHSRGGKTAFALALGGMEKKRIKKKSPLIREKLSTTPPYKFKALIGIDPVAGAFGPYCRPAPKILEYIPRTFKMSVPVAVVGSGYGNQSLCLIPPFAPNGANHSEFFNESKPPVAYFLARDYGHCDMLNDCIAKILSCICKSGKGPRDLMRKGVGGIVVAFLRAYGVARDGKDEVDLDAIVKDPTIAPIKLRPVIYVKE